KPLSAKGGRDDWFVPFAPPLPRFEWEILDRRSGRLCGEEGLPSPNGMPRVGGESSKIEVTARKSRGRAPRARCPGAPAHPPGGRLPGTLLTDVAPFRPGQPCHPGPGKAPAGERLLDSGWGCAIIALTMSRQWS